MLNVLILGHNGFVGSNVKEYFDKQKCKVFTTNSLNKNTIFKKIKKINIIINCVGENYDLKRMRTSNITYVEKILKNIEKYKKNIFLVHVSSCSVYGSHFHQIPTSINEVTSSSPISLYAKTKLAADVLIENAYKRKNIKKYAIIRPSQVIGANMKSKTYSSLIAYIRYNMFFYISDKYAIRNYIHIKDLIRFIWRICHTHNVYSSSPKIYLLSRSIKLSTIVKFIKSKLKKKSIELTFPKFFTIITVRVMKLLFKKFPLTEGAIGGLTSKVKIKSNLKNFKFKYDICKDYLKQIIQ